jgi:hypothetical protein
MQDMYDGETNRSTRDCTLTMSILDGWSINGRELLVPTVHNVRLDE